MRCRILVLLIAAAAGTAFAEDNGAGRYLERGDRYMSMHQFKLAAETYKIALMRDPDNQEAWEKHKQAIDRQKAIGMYLNKAQSLRREGRFDEAREAARQAVKLDPRNRDAWQSYESSLERDDDLVMVQTEREAWEAYREAKLSYGSGELDRAEKRLQQIYKFTQDPQLKFYAKSYLQKVQLKQKQVNPSWSMTVTER